MAEETTMYERMRSPWKTVGEGAQARADREAILDLLRDAVAALRALENAEHPGHIALVGRILLRAEEAGVPNTEERDG